MSSYPLHKVIESINVPHRLRMGLAVLRSDEPWFDVDESLGAELVEKDRLFSERRDDVFVELSSSRRAQHEIANTLAATLLRDYPKRYRRDGDTLVIDGGVGRAVLTETGEGSRPPLEVISRVLQEDLCVMERMGGRWCLSAASVCFPTRWDLRSKLGLPLDAIHDPVPGYRELLASSADRFFDGLAPGRTVWRSNWSLVDTPVLFQPRSHAGSKRAREIDAQNAGEKIWWRLERQTLHRFPESDAILFTIRVYQIELREFRGDREAAKALGDAIRTMPQDLQSYKAILGLRDAVLAYLSDA